MATRYRRGESPFLTLTAAAAAANDDADWAGNAAHDSLEPLANVVAPESPSGAVAAPLAVQVSRRPTTGGRAATSRRT